jgi:hypothetical protein
LHPGNAYKKAFATGRAADPYYFIANPGPSFYFNVDPAPAFRFNAAPHQSAANLQPLVFRLSTAPI